jgi:hypothetical protein
MSEYIQNYEQSNSNDQSAKFDALKDIPFSGNKIEQTNENELRHRSNGEKAQRLMELSKITELRQNEEAFDNRIQELNRDGAYKYLMTLNGILRGVDRSERGVRSNIQVGEHMAPSRKVQGIILNDIMESLKGIKDNHYRATLAYYTVNNLHLFADGNGRTSRAVYEIFDNPNFNLSGENFIHKTNSANEVGGHGKFESAHGIQSTMTAYQLARGILAEKWARDDKIDPRINEMNSRIEILFGETPDVYLTDDAENNLTPQEKKAINLAFHDGDVALLSLCRILKIKGTSDEVISDSIKTYPNDANKYMAIEVEKKDMDTGAPNEKSHQTFSGWTADDYRTFLEGFQIVQRDSQRTLNDIFSNPESYKRTDGRTWADWLSKTQE